MNDENENMVDTGDCGCPDEPKQKPCKPAKTEWCEPETIDLGDHEIGEPDPCPEACPEPVEICCCHTENPCPVHLKLRLSYTKKGCDKHPCIDSIPPNLGCVPIKAGVGQWDGGVPTWTHACTTGCELEVLEAKHPNFKKYIVPQGETLLDLNTHPEQNTRLLVHRGHTGQPINLREFIALAIKMYKTGMASSGGVDPNSLGLNYAQAADGTMMLAIVADGVAVGSGMALVPVLAADGTTVTGYMLPPAS